ncbi:MAG: hypothetical protein DRN49_07210 [Thaumarchaeota archaeon]|nr:MAG: hypothetical protein DRN49_07210 [Nitrososphaerota archaeon]
MIQMIKDKKAFEEWEREWEKSQRVNLRKNLALVDEMAELARKLKALPPKDPLEEIEVDIKIAKVINALKAD